ncbi:MAG TPA: hypothetical protein VHF50_00710, partial [Solirubrobacterales bacterium]|nr:hypothetical protein [Solirubrobacterales bacterium]
MRRLGTLLAAACLALWALAPAAQAEFGFADVNTGLPNDPDVPAYPAEEAIWAGTCDLSSSSTANGGVTPPPASPRQVPAVRSHCIDLGSDPLGAPLPGDVPWPPGGEPAWRLDPVTQAGSHPDGTATFWFNYRQGQATDGDVKNIVVKLPPGTVGNPEALHKCSALAAQAAPPACPASAQAGMTTLGFPKIGGFANEALDFQTRPVYAIEARDTVTAEFLIAHIAGYFNVPITARGRTNSDYGVDTLALLIPQFLPLGGQAFTFWGVPWAAEHDRFRVEGEDIPIAFGPTRHLTGFDPADQRSYDPSWGPIKPFFTTPTQCSGQRLPLVVEMDEWGNSVFDGGPWVTGTVETDVLTGCDQLQFDPSLTLRPTVAVSDSASGLDVKLTTPQNNDPPASIPGNPDLAHDPAD